MPDKTGEASGWNFKNAYSILHKVCCRYVSYILIYDLLYNILSNRLEKMSCFDGQKTHCHIEFCKNLAGCTINDIFCCPAMTCQGCTLVCS